MKSRILDFPKAELDAIRELATRALDALGDTPDAIAQGVAERQIKAICGVATLCALAEYLTAEVPVPGACWSVNPFAARLVSRRDLHRPFASPLLTIGHTTARSLFVSRFDAGHYPDLMAYPEHAVRAFTPVPDPAK